MCGLVSSVCMMSSRRMQEYLRDRGSIYGAVHVGCGVAECQRANYFVDGVVILGF